MAKKREWSRQFTPRGQKTVNLNVSGIPPTLRARFSAKCRRVGKSQRNLILGWIRNWIEDRRPDEDRPSRELVDTDDVLEKYDASA
jgi:hypothetical protein